MEENITFLEMNPFKNRIKINKSEVFNHQVAK